MNQTQQPSHGLAIASLVLAFFAPPVGIILAVIAKKNGNTSGIAKAGLIASIITTVLFVLFVISCGACMCFCADNMDEILRELELYM